MENTGISWAHHTINFWHGCSKVSPACENCYAEALDKRFHPAVQKPGALGPSTLLLPLGQTVALHWGPHAPRMLRVESATQEAFRYQRRAVKEGRRFRVFTNSMADFFEDRRDLDAPRLAALDVIRQTPDLDWMILTKRPEEIFHLLMVAEVQQVPFLGQWLRDWRMGKPPANVWLGTTAESQEWADKRVPALLAVPAAVRFLSCEPLLGPVDLRRWMASTEVPCKACGKSFWLHDADPCHHKDEFGAWTLACPNCGHCRCKVRVTPGSVDLRGGHDHEIRFPKEMVPKKVGRFSHVDPRFNPRPMLDWIIAGGESGPHARPMHPDWARSLRDQCAEAGVPFHFKQWGEFLPAEIVGHCGIAADGEPIGGNYEFADQTTTAHFGNSVPLNARFSVLGPTTRAFHIGTKAAGRLLDGVLHDAVPGTYARGKESPDPYHKTAPPSRPAIPARGAQ